MRFGTAILVAVLPAVAGASPADAVRAALADCERLPPEVRIQARYLSLHALTDAERDEARRVLAFQANSVSRNSELVWPTLVGDLLLRVHLVDYSWGREVWERLHALDPYFNTTIETEIRQNGYYDQYGRYVAPAIKKQKVTAAAPWLPTGEISRLIALTQSRVPVVDARWWFVQTARQLGLNNKENGVGYYDWLGVKHRNDFFRLIKLNEKDSIEVGRELRAAVLKSGVAQQNRQVVRLQSLTGGAWVTLETDDGTGKGNAVERLKRGDFLHKAEEHYGVLANGLPAYLLCDDKGSLQPSAPDFIGVDDSPLRSGRDGRIHVMKSCLNCHAPEDGLRSIDDWVRKTLRAPLGLQSADYKELVELRRQYFGNLERDLKRDRIAYAEAVKELTGWTMPELARAHARLWDAYAEADRGPEQAARELGVLPARLTQALKGYAKGYGSLPPELAGFLQDHPQGVRAEHWEKVYPKAQEIIKLYGTE